MLRMRDPAVDWLEDEDTLRAAQLDVRHQVRPMFELIDDHPTGVNGQCMTYADCTGWATHPSGLTRPS